MDMFLANWTSQKIVLFGGQVESSGSQGLDELADGFIFDTRKLTITQIKLVEDSQEISSDYFP